MAKYYLTNKAIKDLTDLWHYTYETWSEKQADKYYAALLEFCGELAGKPTLGRKYDEIMSGLLGRRVDQHIIFYRTISDEEIVVIRILHSRMDLKKRLHD